jgi:hypothetical protein
MGMAFIRNTVTDYHKNTLGKGMHKSLLAFCSARPVGLRKAFAEGVFAAA